LHDNPEFCAARGTPCGEPGVYTGSEAERAQQIMARQLLLPKASVYQPGGDWVQPYTSIIWSSGFVSVKWAFPLCCIPMNRAPSYHLQGFAVPQPRSLLAIAIVALSKLCILLQRCCLPSIRGVDLPAELVNRRELHELVLLNPGQKVGPFEQLEVMMRLLKQPEALWP
jgi:hypothetical protein